MLIALDIDGVILDFLGQFLRVYNLRNNERITADDITEFMPHGNLSDLIAKKDWDENFKWFEKNGGYATLQSFEGARTAIENILKAGHEIVYVTARKQEFEGDTIMSFLLNKIPMSKLYFAPSSKEKILRELNPDIFVDDSLKNCDAAEKAGIKRIYVLDYKYNRKPEADKYTRIENLIQLEREIAPITDIDSKPKLS